MFGGFPKTVLFKIEHTAVGGQAAGELNLAAQTCVHKTHTFHLNLKEEGVSKHLLQFVILLGEFRMRSQI